MTDLTYTFPGQLYRGVPLTYHLTERTDVWGNRVIVSREEMATRREQLPLYSPTGKRYADYSPAERKRRWGTTCSTIHRDNLGCIDTLRKKA